MHAEGFLTRKQSHPISLTAAIAINAAAITALMLAKSDYIVPIKTVLIGENIPLQPDPPPLPDQPRAEVEKPSRIPLPDPMVKTTTDQTLRIDKPMVLAANDYIDFPQPVPTPRPSATPLPVLVGAQPDPRFARDFQPVYPPGKQRLGETGKVVVRILVGVDGRVEQIEPVGDHDAEFWKATQRQALRHWRFKPATRDGVPYVSWREMTVRFQIQG